MFTAIWVAGSKAGTVFGFKNVRHSGPLTR